MSETNGRGNRRVLVIDDNRAIHDDFRKILADTGKGSDLLDLEASIFGPGGLGAVPAFRQRYEVTAASQGREGCELVRQARADGRPFALVFVDMRMPPGWDGVETIRHLWEADPDVQTVICTAHSDFSWEQVSERLGASDRLLILKKPFDRVELCQMASAMTEKYELAQLAKLKVEQLERMVEARTADLAATNASLAEQTLLSETLNQVGATLAAELDLQKLVQAVTDAGTRLTRAQFGAFFYTAVDRDGKSLLLYTLSGVPREMFDKFPIPRPTPVFALTLVDRKIVRFDDVTRSPLFGQNAPHQGMPWGHLPVRSYLAVPVVSRSGEMLGALFFGHEQAGVFTERDERVVVGITAQAAVAIDNARLYQRAVESEARLRAHLDAAGPSGEAVAVAAGRPAA
jgi:CheY-like chemotaxis protein